MGTLLDQIREGRILEQQRLLVCYLLHTGRHDAPGFLAWKRQMGLDMSRAKVQGPDA